MMLRVATPRLSSYWGESAAILTGAALAMVSAFRLLTLTKSAKAALPLMLPLYFVLSVGGREIEAPFLRELWDLLLNFLVLAIAAALAWSLWLRKLPPVQRFEQDLLGATERVLKSDAFLQPLLTSIATGERDEELGLKGMPDILRSSRERWTKSETAASIYIGIMAVATVASAVVLVWFGYFVVNDDAAGVGRALKDATQEQANLSNTLSRLEPLKSSEAFRDCCADALTALRESAQDDSLKSALASFDQQMSLPTLEALSTALNKAAAEHPSTELSEANAAVSSFLGQLPFAPTETRSTLQKLNRTIEEVAKRNAEPEARTATVLKRLAIGAVLASFFLAVLRFLGGLHKTERLAAMRAKEDELQARKFYVCLRSAGSNDKLVRTVLSGYLSSARSSDAEKGDAADSASADIVKLVQQYFEQGPKRAEPG